jgi:hypothetical protein
VEEGTKPILITVQDVTGKDVAMDTDGEGTDGTAAVKKEDDAMMPERAASPLAP